LAQQALDVLDTLGQSDPAQARADAPPRKKRHNRPAAEELETAAAARAQQTLPAKLAKLQQQEAEDYTGGHVRLRAVRRRNTARQAAAQRALAATKATEEFVAVAADSSEAEDERLYQQFSVFKGLDPKKPLPVLRLG
jgi:hypothetical protein